MGNQIKKSELTNLVKSMLNEEIKKREVKKRLDEVNARLNEVLSAEDYINFEDVWEEFDAYGEEAGNVLKKYMPGVTVDSNDGYVDGDGFEIGLAIDARVSGSYRPETRYTASGDVGDPAEYPDYEYDINHIFIKNQENDKWELVGSEENKSINTKHPFIQAISSENLWGEINSWEKLENLVRKEYDTQINEDESLWDNDPY